MLKGEHGYNSVSHVSRRARGNNLTEKVERGPVRLTHDVHTLLQERLPRSGSRERAGNEVGQGGQALSAGAADNCGILHLIIDVVVF